MAIDCLYTLAAILEESIIPFKKDILQVLNQCRFDKMKPVREATTEAMSIIKDIGPPVDEEETSKQPQRNARTSRPWHKDGAKTDYPISDSISDNSSVLLPDDSSVLESTPKIDPSKKISSATKKRLEAIKNKEEKKEKGEKKTPRKKKQSIFKR